MTDLQLTTIAIAIVFPLSMLLYSNSRVSDASEALRAEIQEFRIDFTERFDSIDRKLDELIRLFGGLESRS